ncbi:MAG: hypothetical protein ACREDT_08345 [Methylocella sp.]
MGSARVMDNPHLVLAVSDESKDRLESAKIGDLAFFVRRIANQKLADDDVLLLAQILEDVLSEQVSEHVSKARIEQMILAHGRSREKASALAAAIFK